MIPSPFRRFIADLIEATDSVTVSWSPGASPRSYVCSHKSYDLFLNYYFDDDDELVYYSFKIAGGNEASFSVSSKESSDYMTMGNLYSSVQINAGKFTDIGKDFFS